MSWTVSFVRQDCPKKSYQTALSVAWDTSVFYFVMQAPWLFMLEAAKDI